MRGNSAAGGDTAAVTATAAFDAGQAAAVSASNWTSGVLP
jgi:hypothetical protein